MLREIITAVRINVSCCISYLLSADAGLFTTKVHFPSNYILLFLHITSNHFAGCVNGECGVLRCIYNRYCSTQISHVLIINLYTNLPCLNICCTFRLPSLFCTLQVYVLLVYLVCAQDREMLDGFLIRWMALVANDTSLVRP